MKKKKKKQQQAKQILEVGKTKSNPGTLRNVGKVTVGGTKGIATTCECNDMSHFDTTICESVQDMQG